MTNEMSKRFDEELKLYPSLHFEVNRIRMAGGTNFYDFLQSEIDLERKRIVEECQKEMYKAIEGVAQYTIDEHKMFINKNDIKVWIRNLSLINKTQ